MSERASPSPESQGILPKKEELPVTKPTWKSRLFGLGLAGMAAGSAGMYQESRKDTLTISGSAEEKSSVSKKYNEPLLLDSQPNSNRENIGDERRFVHEVGEAEAQKIERIERAQHIMDLIEEKYGDMFAVVCDDSGACQVSLKEGSPGQAGEDLHVFDYRFDESGNCFVKEIIDGEKFVIDEKSGTKVTMENFENKEMEIKIEAGIDQDQKFLSVIGESWPLPTDNERVDDEMQDQFFGEIEESFAQGKTIEKIVDDLIQDGIVDESSAAHDLLHNLFMAYFEETREDKYNYKEKLQNFFTQEDNV